MKIDLITRIRDKSLYKRLVKSAKDTAYLKVGYLSEVDSIGLPKMADTYNRLGKQSDADILCFVHDDVEFISKGWDNKLREIFITYNPDILGVVGTDKYIGGATFDTGINHSHGIIMGNNGVRVVSNRYAYKQVEAIDGLFMCVSKKFFNKNKFSKEFDELYYYDIDLCLRSKKVGITSDILVKHSKPEKLYGKYPDNMKSEKIYGKIINKKYNLKPEPVQDQRCCQVSLDRYIKEGHDNLYIKFCEDYQVQRS